MEKLKEKIKNVKISYGTHKIKNIMIHMKQIINNKKGNVSVRVLFRTG